MKKDIKIGDFYYTSNFTNITHIPSLILLDAKEIIIYKHKLDNIRVSLNGWSFYESKDSGSRSDLCYSSIEEIEQILTAKIKMLKEKIVKDNLKMKEIVKSYKNIQDPNSIEDYKKIIEIKKIDYEIAKNDLILFKIERYKINLKVIEDGSN